MIDCGGVNISWRLPLPRIQKIIKKSNTATRGSHYDRNESRLENIRHSHRDLIDRQREEKRSNALARWSEKFGKPVMQS